MEQSYKVYEKNGITSEHKWRISSRGREINSSYRRMGEGISTLEYRRS